MTRFDHITELHRWQRESLEDLLEEFPEIETMTIDELNKKYNDLYWEVARLFDQVGTLESKADTIKLYIKLKENNK